jgi:hypothetical protein
MTNWSDERRRFMADMGKAGEWSAMLNTHMNRLWIENEMPQYVEEIGGMCDLQDDAEVLILGGSPRAADHLDKIEDAQNRGVPILACNGAGQWMVDKGLRPPEMVIVIDHNLRCLRYLQTDWLPDMTLLGQTVDPQLMKHCEAERRPIERANSDLKQQMGAMEGQIKALTAQMQGMVGVPQQAAPPPPVPRATPFMETADDEDSTPLRPLDDVDEAAALSIESAVAAAKNKPKRSK